MEIGAYDSKIEEPLILKWWADHQIYEKIKANAKNKGLKKFYFLDGPPYTSGKVHLGTAWNKSLKDAFIRYKRMQGFDVWDRAGYDMHGLPTEHATEKKLGIKGKEDILKIGVERFVKECKILSIENMKTMNSDFSRLGVWMDFENAYQSVKPDFIEGVWWLVKRAHDQKRLYEGLRTMHWCPSCATAVAKHELEYKNVRDTSIFLKFKVQKSDSIDKIGATKPTYLIVWTTTPWTIPFNLAVMVHPELEYVLCEVDGEEWIVAKALANVFITSVCGKSLKIVKEYKGETLEGLEYEHPLHAEMPQYKDFKKKHPKLHTVVMSEEFVDTQSGSGLVHCAPGCGPEDYEVGHLNGLPPFNDIDEHGIFNYEPFKGWTARTDDRKFIELLEQKHAIIEKTPVEHDYPHCQRCHNPLVFRTTVQWFFKIEDLREKMLAINKKTSWLPNAAFNAFESWLKNVRDNSITKQRYWGTPLPVWKCESCKQYDVIGSLAELKTVAGKVPEDIHKPWIDEITWKCNCGGVRTRIPDIMDVWLDAGTNSWTCLDYPQRDDLLKALYPAEFILEGKDQIRGWFNVLMICGIIGFGNQSFKNVFMHGMVQDSQGRKMSKSLGNYILPEEVIAPFGADGFRAYFIGGAAAGMDLNYNAEDVKIKYRNLLVFWNLHKFLIEHCELNGLTTKDFSHPLNPKGLRLEESFIMSRLHSTIRTATKAFEEYKINEVPGAVEDFFLDVSRTYIQLIREKAQSGDDLDKEIVGYVLYECVKNGIAMYATICPFITESMFKNLKTFFGWKGESVHALTWPAYDEKYIRSDLEQNMKDGLSIVQGILAGREKAQLGVRWPMKKAVIISTSKEVAIVVENLDELIKSQANIKELRVLPMMPEITIKLRPDPGSLGKDFKALAPKIIAKLIASDDAKTYKKLQEKGFVEWTIEKQTIKLLSEHIIVDRQVPDHLIEITTKLGMLYLDKTRTPELEAEGFARELSRRIQAFRKINGLNKRDRVILHIQAHPMMAERMKKHVDEMKAKVGANKFTFTAAAATQKYIWQSNEKIREEEFVVWMEKVE